MESPGAATLLFEAILGYRVTQAVCVAAKLGIADYLEEGARSSSSIAQVVGVPPESLHRLMRALASVGILEEAADGRFALLPAGTLLRSRAPDSLRAAAIFFGDHRHWTLWGNLIDAVTTGRPIRRDAEDAFAQRAASDPEGAAIFNNAMSALTAPVHASLLAAYDFTGIQTIVDVGGGQGALMAAILTAYPGMHGVLFDIPAVIDVARALIRTAGVERRCRLDAGDFFKEVTSGGDAYVLKWIIHDWDDSRSLQILNSCHAAMGADSKLLIIERILPNRAEKVPIPALAPFFADLNMMVLTPGRERTEQEYRALLEKSGFRVTRLVPTGPPFPHTVVEAVHA
ncbi:MAG TPA: methyltransferase [Methylomirabilota bacterium]|jgi:hypothetical protein